MNFKALHLALTLSALLVNGHHVSSQGAAYFLTNLDTGNYIVSNRIGSDGKLTFGSATWAGGRGSGHASAGGDPLFSQGAIVARGGFVFTINAGSNTVTMFKADARDASKLAMVGGPVSSQGEFPQSIALHPTLPHLCVLNGGALNSVACFTADANLGLLSINGTYRELGIVQTTPANGPPGTASQVLFTSDGKYLVASVKGVPPAPGFLAVWDVDEDGSLSKDYTAIAAPSGGVLPFGLSAVPGSPGVLVAADPGIGVDIFDLGASLSGANDSTTTAITRKAAKNVGAAGVSSATKIPNAQAPCWTAFSQKTGTYFLSDPAGNVLTEVKLDPRTFKASIVRQYTETPNGGILDEEVATVNGRDYLYILAPNSTSIEVFALPAAGHGQHIQSFRLDRALRAAGVNFVPTRFQGMAVLVGQ